MLSQVNVHNQLIINLLKSVFYKLEMKISNLQKIPNFAPRYLYKRGAKLGILLQIANFHLKLIKNGL